ncbi:EGF-containing fibulin-like extracellular matrix protein 2 [Octopus sinensis]|uniref:EGF-containing fibulin-like extracellular matrix protein 2 n=1 Tax=Octopus sinensis TaxID=2607531 RepID=A0A7E6EL58_9MOLL|nr:EGF-containing fibulin-like extracellular matrix protein 2 [Octopus sinensis]
MKNLVLLTTFVLCLWVTTVASDNVATTTETTVASDNVTTTTELTPVDEYEAKEIIEGLSVSGTEEEGDGSSAEKRIPFQWPNGWCYYRCSKKVTYRPCKSGRCRIAYKLVYRMCRRCCPGYRYDRRRRRCIDINECLRRPCQHHCVNTPGSYFCFCHHGFYEHGNHCHDVNECECGIHYCPHPYRCVNTYGSYYCACPGGFHPHGNWCYGMYRGNPKSKPRNNREVIPKFSPSLRKQSKK